MAARLSLQDIESRVEQLSGREEYSSELIYDLLLAYGKPKSTVTRLRKGDTNVASDPTSDVLLKNVVDFRVTDSNLMSAVTMLKEDPEVQRFSPRFVIATDLKELSAIDMRTGESLLTPVKEIDQHFSFFLPWAGMEKTQFISEAHADIKAAERMGKLFDELHKANPEMLKVEGGRHALNVFFTRLLFCFFAEDTGIFEANQFTNALASHTLEDGSDTAQMLARIFLALDTARPEDKPSYLRRFPYVNGQLFTVREHEIIPEFTSKARQMLIELGTLKWEEINPDIFGSMFQTIVSTQKRSDLGQHYTSVPNILKTIEPLFMDALRDEYRRSIDSSKRLEKLLDRISEIKIFDPACGTGNFLVIAYKELRRLEHSILERMAELDSRHQVLFTSSRINIQNFYGIEIEDVAAEIAVLSLWIAKHQMNVEFKDKFGVEIPLIPLREAGHIVSKNACRIDWNDVCPNEEGGEIYLIGNPPYKGGKSAPKKLKEDYPFVFQGRPYSKNLDYIALWFIKGAEYIAKSSAKLSFVTTNSVAQGEHVSLMFPYIFSLGLEIGYAYTSFKWSNNAKRNAGVTVAVISLQAKTGGPKRIYTDGAYREVSQINGYLAAGPHIYVKPARRHTSPSMPPMCLGSMPKDGGNLILTREEKNDLLRKWPNLAYLVKGFVGGAEFIKGLERFCLWISDEQLEAVSSVPEIQERFDRVREYRMESAAQSTVDYAIYPNRFKQISYRPTDSIIFPRVSSERREYIPIGYLECDVVIGDSANAIYDAEPWLFALLTSRMHMVWARAVGGQLETRFRYSNTLVYNNFPVPPLSDEAKVELADAAFRVLDVREYHCECTLAELYDPEEMPIDLREAHQQVDLLVDSLYSKRVFTSDEERLTRLFALYEEMGEKEH
ncbi:DNA methyltransferase [Corynebacterium aquilae]|uniref:site-specific DNA-methyltransferase (adenine-specific) n=1 Tax=Corynebacterium aquilae DSM 44791 TaxID=1431546 RepID=A0A1L7CEY4_9CORY|nr:DNA methyltransferase [Corynebacterium aquilae]APT84409.1 DNA methyltransferase [Corynebacterium aquilae DSM 44791]